MKQRSMRYRYQVQQDVAWTNGQRMSLDIWCTGGCLVGKIMFCVVKIFPEGANSAREFSQHFSCLGPQQWEDWEDLWAA
jgi:hypothetical protein